MGKVTAARGSPSSQVSDPAPAMLPSSSQQPAAKHAAGEAGTAAATSCGHCSGDRPRAPHRWRCSTQQRQPEGSTNKQVGRRHGGRSRRAVDRVKTPREHARRTHAGLGCEGSEGRWLKCQGSGVLTLGLTTATPLESPAAASSVQWLSRTPSRALTLVPGRRKGRSWQWGRGLRWTSAGPLQPAGSEHAGVGAGRRRRGSEAASGCRRQSGY